MQNDFVSDAATVLSVGDMLDVWVIRNDAKGVRTCLVVTLHPNMHQPCGCALWSGCTAMPATGLFSLIACSSML